MNCWHCKTELIWGGDHRLDEEDYPCFIWRIQHGN